LRASIHELNREEFSRKRSFSFDREQRLSRRESLANINSGNAVNENLIAEIEECRRDSLSESHEVVARVNQLPLAKDPEEHQIDSQGDGSGSMYATCLYKE
jgi:hypothetical protein